MNKGELFDPGPGYRWATPRENFVAALLELGTVLLSAAIGALAGCLVFGLIAISVPYLATTASTTVNELTTGGAPSASPGSLNVLHDGAQGIAVIAGLILGCLVAVTVVRRVMRAMPVRSGPLRPTDTEN